MRKGTQGTCGESHVGGHRGWGRVAGRVVAPGGWGHGVKPVWGTHAGTHKRTRGAVGEGDTLTQAGGLHA